MCLLLSSKGVCFSMCRPNCVTWRKWCCEKLCTVYECLTLHTYLERSSTEPSEKICTGLIGLQIMLHSDSEMSLFVG